ncbi:host attachment protein [Azospirillum sp.]|uniref:baeRF12 domain-containing protein n=1 Tax=Azospirillum sp. TaxID=34012 RepID=UPI003D735A68
MRRRKIWIVLAGEAGLRVLQHRTWLPGRFDELAREETAAARQPACELAVDAAGQAGDACAFRPAAVDPGVERGVADLVNQAAAQGLFDGLMLVAPPRALGALRRALGPAAAGLLIREEGRDLLDLPEHARSARLMAMLRR